MIQHNSWILLEQDFHRLKKVEFVTLVNVGSKYANFEQNKIQKFAFNKICIFEATFSSCSTSLHLP